MFCVDSDDDDPLGKKKSKRGVLPKHATQVMKSWLFQHIVVSFCLCSLIELTSFYNIFSLCNILLFAVFCNFTEIKKKQLETLFKSIYPVIVSIYLLDKFITIIGGISPFI